MEDVPDALHVILETLSETTDCEVVGSSDNIQTGYEEILSLKPDALLLDINLNGGTSFELIDNLRKNNFPIPPVVIMTGRPGFEAAQEAVDHIGPSLVKLLEKPFWKSWPTDFPVIKAAILGRMAQLQQEDPDLWLKTQNTQEILFVRSSHMTYRIVVPDILYLDAEKGFTTFVIQGGKNIKVRKTLNELMAKLPVYICRISRDKAVNLRRLEQIDHETNELFLEGCKENFFIGEPFKNALKNSLGI
jgi:two-component system LytT family response regulator